MSLDAGTPPAEPAPPPADPTPPEPPEETAAPSPGEGEPPEPSDDTLDFEEESGSGTSDPLELIEVEHEGQKFRVPRAYHEERAQPPQIGTPPTPPQTPTGLDEREEQEDADDRDYLAGARYALRQFEAITPEQRAEIRAADLERAQALADDESQLRRAIDEAQRRVDDRDKRRNDGRRRSALTEAQQFVEALPKTVIGGWDADKARAVEKYAYGIGFTPQQLGQIRDPQMVNVLEKARRYDAAVAKRKRQQAADNAPNPTATPSRQRGTATTLPSPRDDVGTWMTKERERMKKAGRSY